RALRRARAPEGEADHLAALLLVWDRRLRWPAHSPSAARARGRRCGLRHVARRSLGHSPRESADVPMTAQQDGPERCAPCRERFLMARTATWWHGTERLC